MVGMRSVEFEKIIRQFSSYFGIELSSLTFLFDKIPSVVVLNSKDKILGLRNLVSWVSKPCDLEREAIQNQWIEYVLIYFGNNEPSVVQQMLKDLNCYLSDKVYFIGNNFGPLDILMYYSLYDVTSNLTFQEKEKYLHFSRWFNFIQLSKNDNLNKSVIPFSKSLLYV